MLADRQTVQQSDLGLHCSGISIYLLLASFMAVFNLETQQLEILEGTKIVLYMYFEASLFVHTQNSQVRHLPATVYVDIMKLYAEGYENSARKIMLKTGKQIFSARANIFCKSDLPL